MIADNTRPKKDTTKRMKTRVINCLRERSLTSIDERDALPLGARVSDEHDEDWGDSVVHELSRESFKFDDKGDKGGRAVVKAVREIASPREHAFTRYTKINNAENHEPHNITDINGTVYCFDKNCSCDTCANSRVAFTTAQKSINNNLLKVTATVDTMAQLMTISFQDRPVVPRDGPQLEVTLGGFSPEQYDTVRGYNDLGGLLPCSDEKEPFKIKKVVTSETIRSTLMPGPYFIDNGFDLLFKRVGGAAIKGDYVLETEGKERMTRLHVDEDGAYVLKVCFSVKDGTWKEVDMRIDSESNVMMLSHENEDLLKGYESTAGGKVWGYNDDKPVDSVTEYWNVKARSRSEDGRYDTLKIPKVISGSKIDANIIPLRMALLSENDLMVMKKEGGWIMRGAEIHVERDDSSKATNLLLKGESYIVDLQLDAKSTLDYYHEPLIIQQFMDRKFYEA